MHAGIVSAVQHPAQSQLHKRRAATDFLDSYSVVSDMPVRRAAEVITTFPAWTRLLLQIRRLVTAPFGLSNDGPDAADKLGPFPVEMETEQELIAGFDDKHLDFRVSVMSVGGRIYLGTWVHTHHCGGRFYLRLIMPFHILIARDALARVASVAG
jgi:hypothetical protein